MVITANQPQLPAAETASRIGERIAEIYASDTILGDDEQRYPLSRMSVPDGEGRFIADLVRSEKPRATIEIGMAWGVSTLFILQALFENGTRFDPHVVMDPSQELTFHNAALRSLRDLGIADAVEFYQEPSELVLPRLLQEGRTFDLAFVDGDHRFDYVFTDLRFLNRLLRPGGLVIFDDTNWVGVNLACSYAVGNYGYLKIAEFLPNRGEPTRDQRARARAYRKPLEFKEPPAFVPFSLDFVPAGLVEASRQRWARDLRHRGHVALRAGERERAREYFKLALIYNPSHFKTYLRLLRTYLPQSLSRALGGPSPEP